MTMISPIRYEVEIQAPLSTPVPIPPSIFSSEELVIWIFNIAMNEPRRPAVTVIQVFRLVGCSCRPAATEMDDADMGFALRRGYDGVSSLPRGTGPKALWYRRSAEPTCRAPPF